jgi:hypothetical protein
MARARKVVSDTHSAEMDEVRRTLHSLMLVLESVASSVDAGTITADEAFTALLAALQTGSDDDITNIDGGANDYVGSGKELAGVRPTPTHPRRPRITGSEEMTKDSNY